MKRGTLFAGKHHVIAGSTRGGWTRKQHDWTKEKKRRKIKKTHHDGSTQTQIPHLLPRRCAIQKVLHSINNSWDKFPPILPYLLHKQPRPPAPTPKESRKKTLTLVLGNNNQTATGTAGVFSSSLACIWTKLKDKRPIWKSRGKKCEKRRRRELIVFTDVPRHQRTATKY